MEPHGADEVPVVVVHHLKGTDPDAVDAVIYCVNVTPHTFFVSTRSESFTTADDRTGTVVRHGPPPAELTVRPGETVRLGDVYGWEWDGVVALDVAFLRDGSPEWLRAVYTVKGITHGPPRQMVIPGVGVEGHVVHPFWLP